MTDEKTMPKPNDESQQPQLEQDGGVEQPRQINATPQLVPRTAPGRSPLFRR